MRITGGTARGRALRGRLPEGVRPTSARVREALFSMLGQDLSNLSFLDAYGGSGLIGLEAWSRGAQVVVYERNRETARWIERQGAAMGATWTVRVANVLRAADHFDIVYADPPYSSDPEPVLAHLSTLTRRDLVIETARSARLPEATALVKLVTERRYGATRVWRYRRKD